MWLGASQQLEKIETVVTVDSAHQLGVITDLADAVQTRVHAFVSSQLETGLLQCTTARRIWRAAASRRLLQFVPLDLQLVRGAVITSCRFFDNCTGCPCDNESNSRSLSWSASVYPAVHQCTLQFISARPTFAKHLRRSMFYNCWTTPVKHFAL